MSGSKPAEPGAKHPGDRLASYFENFFRIVTAVSTLGASITFAKIVQTPVSPFQNYGFSEVEIQYLIATSWLFFVLAEALPVVAKPATGPGALLSRRSLSGGFHAGVGGTSQVPR